jgi:hypothetical protein
MHRRSGNREPRAGRRLLPRIVRRRIIPTEPPSFCFGSEVGLDQNRHCCSQGKQANAGKKVLIIRLVVHLV